LSRLYPAARSRSSPRRARLRGSQRNSNGEGIAIGILEHAVAPSVWPVAHRDRHGEPGLACALFRRVRIDAEDADLGPEAASRAFAQTVRPWHTRVGVVRVELQLRAVALERGEVVVRVEKPQLGHAGIERDAPA